MHLPSPLEILIEAWWLNWRNLRGWQCHLEMAALTMLRVERTMDIHKGLLVINSIKDHLCRLKENQRSFSFAKKVKRSCSVISVQCWILAESDYFPFLILHYGQYFVIFLLEQVELTFSFHIVTSGGETEGSTDGSDTNGAGACSSLMINLCISI